MTKTISIIFIFASYFLLNSCGFKPMYKFNSDDIDTRNYNLKVISETSREIQEEINKVSLSKDDLTYEVLLKVQEEQTPLIINTNGTVAKYRIEVSLNFEIIQNNTKDIISSGIARGFAQYDVGESEFNNEDMKKSMTRNATKNALQIMVSKVESSIASLDDN